jgi:hypothetical protein
VGHLDSLDRLALRTQNDSSNVFFVFPELALTAPGQCLSVAHRWTSNVMTFLPGRPAPARPCALTPVSLLLQFSAALPESWLEPCVLDHPHGESMRRDFSRLHLGRTGGSFEYGMAQVLSHMSEMGGAGISAL